MEVRAAIEDTQETKTIVSFGDIITNLTVKSDEPNVLTIRLPNLVDMTDPATQYGDVRVVYEFTPRNPIQRSEPTSRNGTVTEAIRRRETGTVELSL